MRSLSTDDVRQILVQARRLLVLTGAGISVASGLPVYRGAEGSVYDDPARLRNAMGRTLRENPEAVWRETAPRRAQMLAATPNAAHHALVALAAKFDLLVATMNIDNLHRRAGSHEVAELHGNAFRLRCADDACAGVYRDETDPDRVEHVPMPRCPECGLAMRPDIVGFGEAAPEKWEPVRGFIEDGVDAVLFVGCSHVVPVGDHVLQLIAAHSLAPVAIDVNPTATASGDFAARLTGWWPQPAEVALPALAG